jgi:hypothetical protein
MSTPGRLKVDRKTNRIPQKSMTPSRAVPRTLVTFEAAEMVNNRFKLSDHKLIGEAPNTFFGILVTIASYHSIQALWNVIGTILYQRTKVYNMFLFSQTLDRKLYCLTTFAGFPAATE